MNQPYGPPPGHYPPPGYYGPPPGPPPRRGMGGGSIALIVIACMFGGCVTCGAIGAASKKDREEAASAGGVATEAPSPKAAAGARAKPPPIDVTASQLFSDYQGNEVAADDRYKGRSLRVTGTVSDITKDFTDGIRVHLSSSNPFMPIDARVDLRDKHKAAALTKGESVSLLCEGKGMVIGRPQLGGCTIE